ncbi:MAG: hypothetical protein HY961_22265 [Ignavibacteriae bacterium]|nr:hypothetical protein [Ignavibacteriota bacterium]
MDSHRPEETLSSASKRRSEFAPEVVLISGGVNSGKTTAVVRLVAELKHAGIRVGGVLSHGVWSDGKKVGIVVENIASGESRPLAHVDSGSSATRQGRYRFFDDGLYFGVTALLDATEARVIFVDEVGPLELREEGFAPAVRSLLRTATGLIIMVVREGLTEQVTRHFELSSSTRVVRADERGIERLRGIVDGC